MCDTKMDALKRFTVPQRVRIVETYFATKSILLTQRQCRRDFGRNNVPARTTIYRLVAKFRETGGVRDDHRCNSGRRRSADMIGRVIDNFNARVGAVIRQRGAWIEHVINY